jgi:DNA-binding MarR family transcriptional regulator
MARTGPKRRPKARTQKKILFFGTDVLDRAASEFGDDIDRDATGAVFSIRAIAQRINDLANLWLEPFGLTAVQHNYLAVLRFSPNLSLNELSARIHTTNASVTSMINALEARELVAREADPDDGRGVRVNLTRKGRALVDRAIPVHYRNIRAAMGELDAAERRQLVELLAKVATGFERSVPGQ